MRYKKFNIDKELQRIEFKRNKTKYIKYILLSLPILIGILGIIYLSKAKFSSSNSIKIVDSKVAPFIYGDYVLAAYIDGVESQTIPTKEDGYVVDHVECGTDAVGTWDNSNWTLTISNATKRTKCTVYFKTKPIQYLNTTILANAGGVEAIEAKGTPNFSNTATTDEGMYMAEDDYGKSYYYRGAVTNNNVLFSGFYWKIIRINGNGSIRMIYNGSPSNDYFSIGVSDFNRLYDDNAYVGYMYGTAGSSAYESTHKNNNSSTVKQYIDTWYENNLANYTSYLSDTLFCNDRSIAPSSGLWASGDTAKGYGTNDTYYGPYSRIYSSNSSTTRQPILTCPNKNDRFTVSDTTIGNGALTYPIALITIDEVIAAGGSNYDNNSYYLTGSPRYWTLSPNNGGNTSFTFMVDSGGSLNFDTTDADIYGYCTARPVINLRSDVTISSGDGTKETPYVIGT